MAVDELVEREQHARGERTLEQVVARPAVVVAAPDLDDGAPLVYRRRSRRSDCLDGHVDDCDIEGPRATLFGQGKAISGCCAHMLENDAEQALKPGREPESRDPEHGPRIRVGFRQAFAAPHTSSDRPDRVVRCVDHFSP
ncbi:MAG: hypothetical protein R3E48_05560 [Burkholderiaceae bacterium]